MGNLFDYVAVVMKRERRMFDLPVTRVLELTRTIAVAAVVGASG